MGSISRCLSVLPVRLREEDKRKHIAWSFWLMLLAMPFIPATQAIVLVFLIGLAKECWDQLYGSGFCLFDMLGNALGIAGGLALGSAIAALAFLLP